MTALLEIIGIMLALALIGATIIDKERQPIHDVLRVAPGIAVIIGMVSGLSVAVSA